VTEEHPPSATAAADGRALRALTALSAISAELASARSLESSIERALANLREFLAAEETAVWLHAPRGLVRGWGAGPGGLTEARLRAALQPADGAEPAPDLEVAPIIHGERRVGALAVRLTRALGDEDRMLLTALANLLAPELAHAERSRQLEVEVAARTAEIERGRRFTEKIIDSLPLGLYVIDREYRIQSWNRKRETGMQGVSREEALGRTIFEILHRQPPEMLRREFDEVFQSGRMQEYQMESIATGEART
jgi:PAS domain S-box-containing protein